MFKRSWQGERFYPAQVLWHNKIYMEVLPGGLVIPSGLIETGVRFLEENGFEVGGRYCHGEVMTLRKARRTSGWFNP